MGYTFLVVEVAVLALFGAACVHASRNGRLQQVLSAALYGLILEEGDILIFHTYSYSPLFSLAIDHVPVTIALAWATIIYASMLTTETLGVPRRSAPFADALLAVMLDVSFDAVAIRLGMWRWNIPLEAGLFGVPAGNFYAWLFVAFCFSALTRWLGPRARGVGQGWAIQMLIPPVAYGGLLLSLLPFIALKATWFRGPGEGMPVFLAAVALFLIVTVSSMHRSAWRPSNPSFQAWGSRSLFHGYFLWALLANNMHREQPGILLVSLAMAALEGTILALNFASRHRQVSSLVQRWVGTSAPTSRVRSPWP